ncbi:MAG: phosphatidylserine decarboxylase [Thermoplasmata archaeon]
MFAKESFKWIASPLALAAIVTSASLWFRSTIGYVISSLLFLTTIFTAIFFRDPEREVGDGIVSPADGKIAFVDKEGRGLSIIMGLSNVHVTRAPHQGEVVSVKREDGRHQPAFREVSETNESVEIVISTRLGNFDITLITGFMARRILPYVRVGDTLRKGERIGIIRFGSRVNLQLPKSCRITAPLGRKVRAGESQIAEVIDGDS